MTFAWLGRSLYAIGAQSMYLDMRHIGASNLFLTHHDDGQLVGSWRTRLHRANERVSVRTFSKRQQKHPNLSSFWQWPSSAAARGCPLCQGQSALESINSLNQRVGNFGAGHVKRAQPAAVLEVRVDVVLQEHPHDVFLAPLHGVARGRVMFPFPRASGWRKRREVRSSTTSFRSPSCTQPCEARRRPVMHHPAPTPAPM